MSVLKHYWDAESAAHGAAMDWQAAQKLDEEQIQRELEEILDRVTKGQTTEDDADILRRELGLEKRYEFDCN